MALVTKNFSDIITFTRASTGTYFDSNGVLQTAGNNVPRLDYNPITLAAQGLLIEEARTNLITSSAVLPAGVNVTITADTFVAPDGTTTGDQILDNATLGEHYSDSSFTPVAATNYTFSAFIKNIGASSSGFACLRLAGDFSAFVIVNLSTFTVAVTGGAQYVSSSVQAINNGWYRISLTGVSVGTVSSVARVQVTAASNLAPYSGTGEGFAVWGRQLEAGAFPTSYIPTTTTALTRSADVASVNTLSPWYNQTEGTVYAEFQSLSPLTAVQSVALGKYPNVWNIESGANDSVTFWYGIGAELILNGTYNNIGTVPSGINKFAVSLAASGGQSRSSLNGAVAVNRNGTLSGTATLFSLGKDSTNNINNFLNGYLRRLTYYPRALSAAELQAITTP